MKSKKTETDKTNPIQLTVSFTPPAGKSTDKPCGGSCGQSGGHCQSCSTCSGGKAKTDNALMLTGEVLLRMAGGSYSEEQLDGAWDVVKSLLKQHFSK